MKSRIDSEKLTDMQLGSWAGGLSNGLFNAAAGDGDEVDLRNAAGVLALILDGSAENGDRDLLEYVHGLWTEATS